MTNPFPSFISGLTRMFARENASAPDNPRVATQTHASARWALVAARYIAWGLIFLAPLMYLPFTEDPLLAKVELVEIVALIFGALWLLHTFVTKRISFIRSPLHFAFGALALVAIAATLLAEGRSASFWGSDGTGEKTASILAFLVIAWVLAALFERRDVIRASALLLASLGLLGLYTVGSVIASAFGSAPSWLSVNTIGTVNALAYVFAVGFLIAFSFAAARRTFADREFLPRWFGVLAGLVAGVLFVAMVLFGFKLLWIVVAGMLAIMLAVHFLSAWRRREAIERGFSATALGVACVLLAASIFLAFRPLPFNALYQPPVEISPSFRATMAIDGAVLKQNPFFGVGPGNFISAFNRYRDGTFYNIQFPQLWAVRFNHGVSFLATVLATGGILGLAGFLAVVAGAVFMLGRMFLKAREPDPVLSAYGIAALFVMTMWFVYLGNFTASFLLFLALGMVAAVAKEPSASGIEGAPERKSWWRLEARAIKIDSSVAHFLTALVVVLGAGFSLIALWGVASQYAAETYFLRAATVMNQFGNINSAEIFLERAAALNPTESSYYQGRAQVGIASVVRIIQEANASPNESLRARFEEEVRASAAAGRQSTLLAPDRPENWFVLGQLYENIVAFAEDAGDAGRDAYLKAEALDPANPVYPFARGRLELTLVDLLNLRISQTPSGEERARLEVQWDERVMRAKEALAVSADMKPDYAQAHFLLAQIAIREDNLSEAIQRTLNTYQAVGGNDVGVAFQLGVLYYTAGDLDRAKEAFNQAVALNDNYANARYFLGLIWDRKGDRDGALSQFQKIVALNPENEEVKRIIANIKAGKPALTGIVPPLPAPEKRKDAPIPEGGNVRELERENQ